MHYPVHRKLIKHVVGRKAGVSIGKILGICRIYV